MLTIGFSLLKEPNANYVTNFIRGHMKAFLDRAVDEDGNTMLNTAASEGDLEAINLFLAEGVDANRVNAYGESPLYHAVLCGRQEAVRLLLDVGADVNAVDSRGDSILHTAVCYGTNAIVQLLLRAGACVNVMDRKSSSPLHSAVYFKDAETVRALVAKGADIHKADKQGLTPLKIAEKYKNHALLAALRTGANAVAPIDLLIGVMASPGQQVPTRATAPSPSLDGSPWLDLPENVHGAVARTGNLIKRGSTR